MECSLCNPSLGPVILESVHWRLVLNLNQNLLGKCFLATKRHEEDITQLTADEWRELHRQLAIATEGLMCAFAPDHFNYVFLQNQDRHVHMHVVPRYESARRFAGQVFNDPGYPGHYTIDDPARRLSPDTMTAIAQEIERAIGSTEGTTS